MDLRPPPRHPLREPARRTTLLTADGERISAVYDAPRDPARAGLVLVVAHGFTGSWRLADNRAIAEELTEFGAVVSYDARGHGRSSGRTTLGNVEVLDLDAVVTWARWLGAADVVTVGFSMGGSVVLRHAALARADGREATDAVVSVSAAGFWFYRGTPRMRWIDRAVVSRTGRGVLRVGFGTRVTSHMWEEPYPLSPTEAAGMIPPVPLLVVHGEEDPFFPVEHAVSIVAAARAGAVERGVADCTEAWFEAGFAHAESGISPELVRRIGAWARTAVGHDAGTSAPVEESEGGAP